MIDVAEELEAVRSQPIRTPEDAEAASEAARLLAEILRLNKRAEVLLAGRTGHSPASNEPQSDLRGLTLHEAAERVLDEAGLPLHAREIGERVKAGGWRHPRSTNPRRDQIVYQLAARLPRHPETFRRVGPNTFGLVKWDREGGPSSRRKPTLGLFSGPGTGVARVIGESDEPLAKGPAWRSS